MATAKTLQPKASAAGESRPAGDTTPAKILWQAIGIGLIAGFLDLGLLIVKTRQLKEGFYHLSQDLVWLIPAAVALLVLIPGTMLALIAHMRRGDVRPALWWGGSSSSGPWRWLLSCL